MAVAVAAVLGCGAGLPAVAIATPDPIGAHSMLELSDPPSFMQAMFAQAAGMGASAIRLDVLPALIFTRPGGPPNFTGLHEVMSLSQQYHLPVVADLLTIPSWIADCVGPSVAVAGSRCATDDLTAYSSEITQIVSQADPVIQDWEIWNEPDSGEFFSGTPQQYAQMLRTAHDAIKQIDPSADVLIGGLSGTGAMSWLAQVFATPGADAAQAFDIANVHERAPLDSLASDIGAWRQFFAGYGFDGPLWVTEHGYPSDPAYQYDPAYGQGASSQASYLTASIPTLIDAGAAKVFVTERDNLAGQFASEGLLGGDVLDPPVASPLIVEKPAYAAVRALAGCYMLLGRDCAGSAPVAAPSAVIVPTAVPGATSSSTVAVSDPGPGPDSLGTVAVTGPQATSFAVASDGCSGRILEPDQTCDLTVRFTPTVGGAAQASLSLPSDNGPLNLLLSSVAPSVSSLASAVPTFHPAHRADGVGYAQSATVRLVNPLDAGVHITGGSVTGPDPHRFTIQVNRCAGASLRPGGACSLQLRFVPTRAGTAGAKLTMSGDGTSLGVLLGARAFAVVRVVGLRRLGSGACSVPAPRRPLDPRVQVTTDQAASVSWRMQRTAGPATRGCAPLGGGRHGAGRSSPAAGSVSPAQGRATSAHGRVSTAHPAGWGRRDRYVARFALPARPGLHGLRPGTYVLRVTARNAHGSGSTRSLRVTVGGKLRVWVG